LKKQITINKEWYDKLTIDLDELAKSIFSGNKTIATQGINYIVGYVNSLDQHFKGDEKKPEE